MPRKSSTNHLKSFNGIFLKRIAPPTCSRLYGIEPIGVGTPLVESLTSYLERIASAHCVSIGTLISKEIAPIINKPYVTGNSPALLATVATTFLSTARSINGFGVTATDWVSAIQNLTSKQELCLLTMLPWKGLIAKSKLLRKVRAWCPCCYQEWHETERPIYDPLLWSLHPVKACIKHKRFLRYQCNHCNKQITPLVRRQRSGFCPHCCQWLGVSTDNKSPVNEILTGDQLIWHAWVFDHVGTILATASRLPSLSINGVVIADLVSACIQMATRGDLQAFVRRFNSFSQRTIDMWRRGDGLPELGGLMDFCYRTNVSMRDVLLGNMVPEDILSGIAPVRKSESRYVTSTELESMEAVLRSMLNEDPPPSLNEVVRRLGRYVQTIRRYFPRLYGLIKERYSTYEAKRFDKVKIKSSLVAVVDETPPPSLQSVAKHLGCSRGFLRENFPEEAGIIVERYVKFQRSFIDPEGVRAQLQVLQTEVPPLSITKCAERLGCSYGQLYEYFPEICHVIGARHAAYCKENARQRREIRRQAIIKAKLDLESERISPTLYQSRKRLSHIKNLTNLEIDAALSGTKDNVQVALSRETAFNSPQPTSETNTPT